MMSISFSLFSVPVSVPKSPPMACASTSSSSSTGCRCSLMLNRSLIPRGVPMRMNCRRINRRAERHIVRMAPDEEKLTRRNPLDFPIEWERPKPGRRPDIFPKFSPMKTPLPPPLPCDPPEEDEEEEENKDEEEENPIEEEPDKPENL